MKDNTEWMRPAPARPRTPGDPARKNGRVINPPLYAEMGGLTGPSKTGPRNDMIIEHTKGK